MKNILFSCALITIFNQVIIAQDVTYSQFYNTPAYLNPALAGSHFGSNRVNINFRNHNRYGSSINNSFFSSTLSTDFHSPKLHGGFVIQMTNHTTNKNNIIGNSLSLGYSYHQTLSNKRSLLFGIQVGWQQNFANWDKIAFTFFKNSSTGLTLRLDSLPDHKTLSNGWVTSGAPDVNFGFAIVSKNLSTGIVIKHLNRPLSFPYNNIYKLPLLFTGHISNRFKIEDNLDLSQNAMVTIHDGFISFVLGANAHLWNFIFGAGFRDFSRPILNAGFEKEKFNLFYSFDFTIGPQLLQHFSHEGSILFYF